MSFPLRSVLRVKSFLEVRDLPFFSVLTAWYQRSTGGFILRFPTFLFSGVGSGSGPIEVVSDLVNDHRFII